MLNIGIIIGSTRPGRKGAAVGKWVYEQALKRDDAKFELVDIQDYNLPLLDEPQLAAYAKYEHEHTKVWSKKIAEFDGFVFVTPEYNHTTSPALKNALDYLYNEWADKSAGFVGYGAIGGARAIEGLRQVAGQLSMADVASTVGLSIFSDFEGEAIKPGPRREGELKNVLDEVVAWGGALKGLREK